MLDREVLNHIKKIESIISKIREDLIEMRKDINELKQFNHQQEPQNVIHCPKPQFIGISGRRRFSD